MSASTKTIRLGSPRDPWYLSKMAVRAWSEAAAVCLAECGHGSGVEMTVDGFGEFERVRVEAPSLDDAMRRTHRDLTPATELGALAVVASLVHDLTDDLFLEQSIKPSGIDYWLGRRGQGNLFQGDKTRLEISGILRASNNSVEKRFSEKFTRLDRYDDERAAKVAVVEFSAPKTAMREH
jgi:hypothetical protein